MSEAKTRKVRDANFKAKVALEAVRETKTLNEIGQEYGVHPVQVESHWKKALLEKASDLFEGKRGTASGNEPGKLERLCSEIGRLKRSGAGLAETKSGLSLSR